MPGRDPFAKLERVRAGLEPGLRRAFDAAIRNLRNQIEIGELVAHIEHGEIQAAIDMLFGEGRGDPFSDLKAKLHDSFRKSGETHMRTDVPATVDGVRVRTAFDIGNPAAARIMERLDTSLFPTLKEGTESGFRKAIIGGLEAGQNPRRVAIIAREFVGLTEYDHSIMQTFELALRSGDYAAALRRELRDQRFDGTLRKLLASGGKLSDEQVRRMGAAYGDKLFHWRSETWSRTASLQATRQGNLAAWRTSFEAAGLGADRIAKTWMATNDNRTRPEHRAAHGLTVMFEEEFPVDGGVQVPGEGVYNCRCSMTVRVVPRNAERRAEFLAARDRQANGDREGNLIQLGRYS